MDKKHIRTFVSNMDRESQIKSQAQKHLIQNYYSEVKNVCSQRAKADKDKNADDVYWSKQEEYFPWTNGEDYEEQRKGLVDQFKKDMKMQCD